MSDSNDDGYDDFTGLPVTQASSPTTTTSDPLGISTTSTPGSTSTASLQAMLAQIGAGSTTTSDPNDPFVFAGWNWNRSGYKRDASESGVYTGDEGMYGAQKAAGTTVGKGRSRTPRQVPISQLQSDFAKLSPREQRKWASWLALAGYAGSVDLDQVKDAVDQMSQPEVEDAYNSLLKDAAQWYGAGHNLTPKALLRQRIAYRLGGIGVDFKGDLDSLVGKNGELNLSKYSGLAWGAERAHVGDTYSTTTTQKSVDFMDPADARNLTRAMLQQQLGRDPTDGEYEDFIAMLHNAEKANPSVSRTTYNYEYQDDPTADAGASWQATGANTVTHSGITESGEQQLAYEKAQQNPDWAEWQAVGTYAPALFDALGSTVSGV